jgi:uncharacterized 2Fe-2S/4Fe-4S cluster protein (DUF4445 family)
MTDCIINGEPVPLMADRTIFEHADRTSKALYEIPTSCGRDGTCGECIVQITAGSESLNNPTPAESFLQDGTEHEAPGRYRLACQARVESTERPVIVETLRRTLRIVSRGRAAQGRFDPAVTRKGNHVLLDGERIDARRGGMQGLAIDIGTSTVVLTVVDLETGQDVATACFENPQKYAGSNVVHRISYDTTHAPGRLFRSLLAYINAALADMPIDMSTIYEVVVAANSTMRDIFFRLDVHPLGQRPFRSVTQHELLEGKRTTTAVSATAESLDLNVFPGARVYGLPLIASHVGADAAAGLLCIGIEEADEPVLFIATGTNTEVVLGTKGRIMAASCPAGPAFEGAGVPCGMSALDGAIENVRISGDRFDCRVIGDGRPRGICGSGLIDLLAELKRTGRMDELGRLTPPHRPIPLPGDVVFTPADISHLAQAKAANAVGQQILIKRFGLRLDEIARYYLAGGFASYVVVPNAITIGLIPPLDPTRIEKVGNTAIEGAKRALLSVTARERLDRLVRRIEHVELEQQPEFFDLYVDGAMFQPIRI